MRRGLVLEGGGAKGAYALGCLIAFREYGIHFDVVAGSSAGALNGALVGAGRLDSAKALWQQLRFSNVCRPSQSFSTWVLLPLHIIAMLLHNYPVFGSLPFAGRQPPKAGVALIAVLAGVPIGLMWILFGAFALSGHGSLGDILAPTICVMLLSTVWAIPYLIRAGNRSFLTAEPLRCGIKTALTDASFSVPTYVTLADRQVMFDPDKPGFYHLGGPHGYVRRAMVQEEYVPYYVRLDALSTEQRIDVLTASAAIPFGIFPAVVVNNSEYIDGGMADNTPLVPVLRDEHCDEVYVVRLRPHREIDLARHWQRVDRRLRVASIGNAMCEAMYRSAMKARNARSTIDDEIDPPENVPYREFPLSSSRLIVVAPRTSLGSFLRGTMNFSSRYSTRLTKLGYMDACEILDKRHDIIANRQSSP